MKAIEKFLNLDKGDESPLYIALLLMVVIVVACHTIVHGISILTAIGGCDTFACISISIIATIILLIVIVVVIYAIVTTVVAIKE